MHLLHLEDDKFLSSIFKDTLDVASPNVKLSQFANSDNALEFIKENKDSIKLYLLDIRVQGSMAGLDLARSIRDLDINTPIIITSAYDKPRASVLQELKCQWVAKPWHILGISEIILPHLLKAHIIKKKEDEPHNNTLRILGENISAFSDLYEYPDIPKTAIPSDNLLFFIATSTEPIIIPSQPIIRLGRKNDQLEPTVDLTPYHASELGVSRYHAEITGKRKSYFIKDMGSTNGTRLNSTRLTPFSLHILKDNDHIRLGHLSIIFKIDANNTED